jgi:hypothetical protein
MPGRLPESIRSEVMQRWYRGESRNKIAAILGISQAATSGIIDECKRSVGVTRAELIRDFSIALDRHNISIAQCVQGYRTLRQLSKIGVDEDEVESFVAKIYNGCIGSGMRPQDIVSHLKDLVSWTDDIRSLGIKIEEPGDDDNGSSGIPRKNHSISQIARYLERSKEEIRKSKEEVKQIELKKKQQKNECELQEAKKLSISHETADMLKEHDMTVEKLDWYKDMKTELLVSGYSEKDFELVLKAINFTRKKGFNLLAIVAEFSEYERLKSSAQRFNVQVSILEKKFRDVEEKIAIGEQMIESKSQLQRTMVELESMGFGFKQLKHLLSVIKEINEANGFSGTDGYAVKIFQEQVESYYDCILGFEKRVEDLKTKINNLQIQYLAQVNVMSAIPYVGSALVYLLNKGVQVDQIVKIAKLSQTRPDIIEPFTRSEAEQDKHDDFPLSTSSTHFSISPSFSSSSSSSSPSSPSSSPTHPPSLSSFQSQPQTTLGSNLKKSSSSSLPTIEPPSKVPTTATTKPSADETISSEKESHVQSLPQTMSEQQPQPMKVQHDFARVKPDESTRADKSSQPLHMRSKENIKNLDKLNSNSFTRTVTVRGKEVSIPNDILLGLNQFDETEEIGDRSYSEGKRS